MKDIKNMSDEEKKDAINKLVADIDCLEPVYQWTNDLNIFNVLKLDRVEIRHSNMLAWLLNPNESHGLEDKLLKKILIKASNENEIKIMNGLTPVNVEVMDLDDVVVSREYPTSKNRRIDVLAVSKRNRLVVAIENKIGSIESNGQLNDYKDFLCNKYPEDYHFVLIYLTPNGEESSDNKNWVNMDYKFILDKLEKLVKIYKIPDKAQMYISDYTKAIRRSVVEDTIIEEMCKEIYNKHPEAFDLIFENKPDICSQISDYIFDYLSGNATKFKIKVWAKHYKHNVDFTPEALSDVCGDWGNGDWNGQKNLIGFEFYIGENYGVKLSTIIGPSDDEHDSCRQKLFDIAKNSENFTVKSGKLSNVWKTIDTYRIIKQDVINELRGKSEEETKEILNNKIGEKIEKYIREKMPKMVDDLLEAFN